MGEYKRFGKKSLHGIIEMVWQPHHERKQGGFYYDEIWSKAHSTLKLSVWVSHRVCAEVQEELRQYRTIPPKKGREKRKAGEYRNILQEKGLRANWIKPSGRACQPGSDLPEQTPYSVWRSAFADPDTVSSGIGICPWLLRKYARLLL